MASLRAFSKLFFSKLALSYQDFTTFAKTVALNLEGVKYFDNIKSGLALSGLHPPVWSGLHPRPAARGCRGRRSKYVGTGPVDQLKLVGHHAGPRMQDHAGAA